MFSLEIIKNQAKYLKLILRLGLRSLRKYLLSLPNTDDYGYGRYSNLVIACSSLPIWKNRAMNDLF